MKAKEVVCWGTGTPLREFLYVDDLADACVYLMNTYSGNETVNLGTGKELTIRELTELEATLPGTVNYNIAIKTRGEDIIFLRKIIPGGADRSYGIEVAKLAGLPEKVVRRAKQVLKELESENGVQYTAPRKESDQVSLDAIGEGEVLDAIRRCQPDTLTPIEAMSLLYELKKKLS